MVEFGLKNNYFELNGNVKYKSQVPLLKLNFLTTKENNVWFC